MPSLVVPFYTEARGRSQFWRLVQGNLRHRLNTVVEVDLGQRENVARSLLRIVRRYDLPAVIRRLPNGVAVLFL